MKYSPRMNYNKHVEEVLAAPAELQEKTERGIVLKKAASPKAGGQIEQLLTLLYCPLTVIGILCGLPRVCRTLCTQRSPSLLC